MAKIVDLFKSDKLDRRTWMEVSLLVVLVGIFDLFYGESLSMLITGIILVILGFFSTKKK